MPSNVENILNAILTGDGSGIQKPASRVEELLFEIYEQGGGGGDSVIGGIKLTIDSNYVMTATLVDKDGEEYGVSDDIDLPLETMVVDGEYDSQTQKIKLELKNGNYVEFSVADLVSGLQTELSSSNKLNPTYIDYDSTHRAVSDTEKNTWNAKQNAISDLAAIRSGASAGSTAVQPSALETALSTKQDTISDLAAIRSGASAGATAVQPATMSTALALKQDSLSEAQLAAVNSGIDSSKVGQISTNQTNILLVGKQIDAITNALSASDFTWTLGKVISSYGVIVDDAPYGAITDAMNIDSATAITAPSFSYQDNPINCMVIQYNANNEMVGVRANAAGDVVELLDTATYFRLSFQFGSTSGVTVTQEIINSVFKCNLLYSAENTANAVVELVDDGAKNVFTPTSAITGDAAITVVDNGDGSYNVTGGSNETIRKYVTFNIPTTGDYVLSGCPNTGSNDTYRLDLRSSGGTVLAVDYGSGSTPIHLTAGTGYQLSFRFNANYTAPTTGLTFKPMICTEADWKVSKNYVPYALPNTDLTVREAEDRAALMEVIDKGAKNLVDFNLSSIVELNVLGTWNGNVYTYNGVLYTVDDVAKTINVQMVSGTTTHQRSYLWITKTLSNVYTVNYVLSSGNPNASSSGFYITAREFASPYKILADDMGNNGTVINYTSQSQYGVYIEVLADNVISGTQIVKPMVCSQAEWKISKNHEPHALPNTDLTVLEAEDRAALAEEIDSGAKNEFEFGEFTPGGTTIIIAGNAVTLSGTAGWAKGSRKFRLVKNTKHIISYTITESTTNGAVIMIAAQQNGGGTQYYTKYHGATSGTYVEEFYAPVDTDLYFVCTINNSATQLSEQVTMTLTDIMICSQADWKVSQKYVPYRKSLDELEATKAPVLSGSITSGDLNDVTINTFAMYANTVSSLPTSDNYYVETSVFDANSLIQRAYNIATAESYVRVKCVGTWSAWKQITNA